LGSVELSQILNARARPGFYQNPLGTHFSRAMGGANAREHEEKGKPKKPNPGSAGN
jgi:hypothetical protein